MNFISSVKNNLAQEEMSLFQSGALNDMELVGETVKTYISNLKEKCSAKEEEEEESAWEFNQVMSKIRRSSIMKRLSFVEPPAEKSHFEGKEGFLQRAQRKVAEASKDAIYTREDSLRYQQKVERIAIHRWDNMSERWDKDDIGNADDSRDLGSEENEESSENLNGEIAYLRSFLVDSILSSASLSTASLSVADCSIVGNEEELVLKNDVNNEGTTAKTKNATMNTFLVTVSDDNNQNPNDTTIEDNLKSTSNWNKLRTFVLTVQEEDDSDDEEESKQNPKFAEVVEEYMKQKRKKQTIKCYESTGKVS